MEWSLQFVYPVTASLADGEALRKYGSTGLKTVRCRGCQKYSHAVLHCCSFVHFKLESSAQQALLYGTQHSITSQLVTVQPVRPQVSSHTAGNTKQSLKLGQDAASSSLVHNQSTPVRYSLACRHNIKYAALLLHLAHAVFLTYIMSVSQ